MSQSQIENAGYRPVQAYSDEYVTARVKTPRPARASAVGRSSTQCPSTDRSSTRPHDAAASSPEGAGASNFVVPHFPYTTPLTKTESSSAWAIMLEQGAQAYESYLGPLLEAIACDAERTAAYEAVLRSASLPCPPFSAAACCDLLRSYPVMRDRLPLAIKRRAEAAAEALTQLRDAPEMLRSEQVLAGHTALRSTLQDCVKAIGTPSLLGRGSREFLAFTARLLPQLESQVLYFDMLLADCREAAQPAPSNPVSPNGTT